MPPQSKAVNTMTFGEIKYGLDDSDRHVVNGNGGGDRNRRSAQHKNIQHDDDHESLAPSILSSEEEGEEEYSDYDTVLSEEGGGKAKSVDQELEIAKEETTAVSMLKVVVVGVLLMAMIGVSVLAYYYLRTGEEQEFEANIYDESHKILESIISSIDTTLGSIDALVVGILSTAKSLSSTSSSSSSSFNNNSTNTSTSTNTNTWPFVTIPDHALRLSKTRSVSRALIIQQYQLVLEEQRTEWEEYALRHGDQWVEEALYLQASDSHVWMNADSPTEHIPAEYIYYFGEQGQRESSPAGMGRYLPTWQSYPIDPNSQTTYNWNALQQPRLEPSIKVAIGDRQVVLSDVINFDDDDDTFSTTINEWVNSIASPDHDASEPVFQYLYPMVVGGASSSSESTVVAVLAATVAWTDMFGDVLPTMNGGLDLVVMNTCNQTFTFRVDGTQTTFVGQGDLHDKSYDKYEVDSTFAGLEDFRTSMSTYSGLPISSKGSCEYSFHVYPTTEMENSFYTSNPIMFALASVFIFVFTSMTFLSYDWIVAVRQEKVITTAKQSSAIVSSLFPRNVRDRLYNEQQELEAAAKSSNTKGGMVQPTKAKLKNFLNHGDEAQAKKIAKSTGGVDSGELTLSRPIADLFPETTVLFADISKFTAWSSVRDPTQVFTLLETIYGAFDEIASRRGVFKVETIGDSYVAVSGLPEPRQDHAIVMVKFARDCREKFTELSRRLEQTLGPDTGELAMRFGLHSGPTTAGVLRGQKSRFQLFGDTVNTASRMESTGVRNLIQISQATADLLIEARKSHWIRPRKETIEVKGKGQMQTYWVEPKSSIGSAASSDAGNLQIEEDKTERLVGWITDVMGRLILQIIDSRNNEGRTKFYKFSEELRMSAASNTRQSMNSNQKKPTMVLDEVKEVIELPEFNSQSSKKERTEYYNIDALGPDLQSELREYVMTIARAYNDNPFHNFMHAAHVCMSVAKLMGRIVAPDQVLETKKGSNNDLMSLASSLHDHTYGITSDPLTQLGCVYAALIHDVDHPGIPNSQMVKEDDPLAIKYQGKSVAEQNSVDISWEIFMDAKYAKLREAICPTENELRRFRQLVVNAVMATDIMDKDLKALRNERWDKAFCDNGGRLEAERSKRNRKATIVIEHLIQASDIAHTMQHWHVYRKWNERLFREMSLAYRMGRADKDPADFWYQGELGFFDFYIIPLTKKLSECGVFGVSSDELLNYALKNREEWEQRGRQIVAEMVDRENAILSGGLPMIDEDY